MKDARLHLRWSQAYVGKRLGVSGPTYGRWEVKGEVPKIDQLEAVAALLGIPRDEALRAAGAGVTPTGEAKLYPRLVAFLEKLPLDSQRDLLSYLEGLGKALEGAQ